MGKLFGTDGIRGIANEKMTAELSFNLGKSFAIFLLNSAKHKKILLGQDTRVSGQMLSFAFVAGLNSMGFSVIMAGIMPTPALSFLVNSLDVDGGVMITASHNPAEFNGLKLYDANGLKLTESAQTEIEKIYCEIDSYRGCPPMEVGHCEQQDLLKKWIDHIAISLGNPKLDGLKIALDTANGASSLVAPYVFKMLGAITTTYHNSIDGKFINKDCGSTYIENFVDICIKNKFDYGISFDGDADRVAVVCRDGKILDGADLLWIFANYMHQKGELAGDCVVSTVITNCGLEESLKKRGISMIRTPVGGLFVQQEMIKQNCVLGVEESGHIMLRKVNFEACGITSAVFLLKILLETGKSVNELLEGFERTAVVKADVDVSERQKRVVEEGVLEDLCAELENELNSFGRVVLRTSGTESVARVLVEGKDKEILQKICNQIVSSIKSL